MKRRLFLFLTLFALSPRAEETPWTSLFNGTDLAGWTAPTPNPFWRVEQGVLVGENDATKKGSMLYTTQSYTDFELEAEAKWEGEIDSGFMMRKPELQVQLGVSRSLKRDMTGSFYVGKYPDEAQAKNATTLMKANDWNTYKIQMKGATCTVWINGTHASTFTDGKYKDAGPIGLQIHGGLAMKVAFRNLRIRSLPVAP
jgi:hypothetical protein